MRAVVQPGGSVRDDEVIDAAAKAAGVTDVLHRHPALLPLTRPGRECGKVRCSAPRILTFPAIGGGAWGRGGETRRAWHNRRVTAQILDGKATARAIKADLTTRVARLAEHGVRPGLGTVLIGDDPGSQSYVAGKHRDCEQVGIASIKEHHPSDITQEFLEERITALNEDPACTGFIVQLPLPRHLDSQRALELVDPAKDADGLHPINLGRLVLMADAPLPCTPRGIVELLTAYDVEAARRRGLCDRSRRHRRASSRSAADPPLRERHRDPVPHRHP